MKRIIYFGIALLIINVVSLEAKKEIPVRIGFLTGIYFPTNSFVHQFKASPIFTVSANVSLVKKRQYELSLTSVIWNEDDNPGVENLRYSLINILLSYNFYFTKSLDGIYIAPALGYMFKNYTYKDEYEEAKIETSIFMIGLKLGYVYRLNERFLLNGVLNGDLGLNAMSDVPVFTGDKEFTYYYGFGLGVMYEF
jgi:hypothetical protein